MNFALPHPRSFLYGLPAVVALVSGAIVACSSATPRDGFNDTDAGSSSGTSGSSGSSGFGGDAAPPPSTDGCSEEAKLVYVLSLEGDIYSFAPALKKFTKIGPLSCKSGNAVYKPVSMAVARDATAWVNMRPDGGMSKLFKVDTKTAKCTPTAIEGNIGGMGFSTNEGTTDKETLFVIGASGLSAGLVKVDLAKEELVPIAPLEEPVDPELTGTGDGRLYGFLITSPFSPDPLSLAQVNKTTSAFTNKVPLPTVDKPQAPMFAFSFWGGDFYFYTATDTSPSDTTTVSRYQPTTKDVDNAYMTQIGFHIVGAGVSTCAPTSQPK